MVVQDTFSGKLVLPASYWNNFQAACSKTQLLISWLEMLTSCFHLKGTLDSNLQVGKENRHNCHSFDPELLLFRGELMKESMGEFLLRPCLALLILLNGESSTCSFLLRSGAPGVAKPSQSEQQVSERLLSAHGTAFAVAQLLFWSGDMDCQSSLH